MKARIIRIGNSKGLRIPKALLELSGLDGEVELKAVKGGLTIRSAKNPRAGWAAAAREMARRGDDKLIDPPTPTKFDLEEWEW